MSRAATRVRATVASAGLATVVLGSFLPWLHSGAVQRSSYEMIALADHFELFDSLLISAVLWAWVAVPVACAACVVAYALSLHRSAGVGTCILAALLGTVAVLVAVQSSDTGTAVGVTQAGPVVTAAGAVVALAGGLAVLVAPRRTRGRGDRRAGVRA